MPNQGHRFELPAGLQLSQLMQQVWAEQYAAIQQAIKLFGKQGIQAVDLSRWQSALIRRLLPIARVLIHQGKDSLQTHTNQKHIKRGAAVQLLPGSTTEPPTGQVNEYIEVFDPRVAELARTWAYDFAQSTLQTSQFNIFDAYKMTGQSLAYGLEQGQTLDELTQAIGMIFNDPYRAGMIAASEASRLFHGGQILSAKESGEVEGKTWLASSDACDACLELNGKTVPLDQPFVVKAGRYGVVMHPPLHPWCMCSLLYEMLPLNREAVTMAIAA